MWHGFFNRFFFRFIPEFGWFEEGFAPRTEEGERMSSCVHTSSEKTLREGVKKKRFFLGLCPKLCVGGGPKSTF